MQESKLQREKETWKERLLFHWMGFRVLSRAPFLRGRAMKQSVYAQIPHRFRGAWLTPPPALAK